ncbi:MAG: hypothetical protein NC432_03190 [Roseburia sp.]|nr:hypothetical protein [Roseburia sp.]MCM1097061.1 hypothetical protein [Ruminococcus flavefaciens]
MKKRRKKKKRLPKALLFLVILLAAAAGGYLYVDNLAYKVCRVEAGIEVFPSDFLRQEDENAFFAEDSEPFSIDEPGEYRIRVTSGLFTHTSTLIIEDTTPPEGTLRALQLEYGTTCAAPDFVEEIRDATAVTVTFAELPDISAPGTQQVKIKLTDRGDNSVILETQLFVAPVRKEVTCNVGGPLPKLQEFLIGDIAAEFVTDLSSLDLSDAGTHDITLRINGEDFQSKLVVVDTVPPVISGAEDITIYVGDTIAYRKNVTVTDNCPGEPQLEIDNSQVNPNAAGSYPVVYRATDASGNVAERTITVTIQESMYSQETVDALADAVLARILTDDMTQLDKADAIFNYIRGHVGYISHSEKGDWLRAAYEGLADGQGDCYVFACTAKELLTRAGITNMDIAKIPAETSHYWNLVDVGDGWYHYDTTPRKDHPRIFMWTDEQMMEYSESHKLSHNYDHDAYPEVN